MSPYKVIGCCSLCDTRCFEVTSVTKDGRPKTFGRPNDGATRITFLLFDGHRTDMTFCEGCAQSLSPENYTLLWRKNLNGYLREQKGDTTKFKDEFVNGLLCELGRIEWKEFAENGR